MLEIPGHPNYFAEKDGKIWSAKSKRYLRYRFHNKGYPTVSLCHGGVAKNFLVHRLIAMTFIPNPLNLPTVNHKNGDRSDPKIQNLEWMSYQDNCKHSFNKLGRIGGRVGTVFVRDEYGRFR